MQFITRGAGRFVLTGLLVGLGSPLAHAGVTATAAQVGNNVVFTANGTLDVSGLLFFAPAQNVLTSRLSPTAPVTFFATAPISSGQGELYVALGPPSAGITGPASFGTGGLVLADSGTGTFNGFGLDSQYATNGAGIVAVPLGYVSGSPLSSTATYNNRTLATLGITPGVYTWTWPTATGGTDFYRIVAPEPASLSLVAAAGVMFRRRRSR